MPAHMAALRGVGVVGSIKAQQAVARSGSKVGVGGGGKRTDETVLPG